MSIARISTRTALAVFALVSLGCAKDTTAVVDPNVPVAVITAGLSTPESVLWDATRNVWYVSNINGSPLGKDDNGYILRLAADGGTMDSVPFINGADDDITLNAPKGMALIGDTLWVTDIDAVRAFDVGTGNAVATIEMASLGATFLNDAAASNDGKIYITDSGFSFSAEGAMTHPGESRVFVIDGRVASSAVILPRESAANGIAWDSALDAWLIVAYNAPNVFAWGPGGGSVATMASGPGGGDGIVVLTDGRAVFSSWADSSLSIYSNGTVATLRKGLPGAADLGYDPARNLIAVPLFMDNRVELIPIPPAAQP